MCGGGWTSYLKTCETYDPGTNTWSSFGSMNIGRRTLGLVEAGGRLYAEGGYNGSFLAANESLLLPAIPGSFSKTSPANGATGVAVSPTLWWGVSAGAVSYEYCIDTTNDSACSGWVSSGSATSAGVGPLAYGTAYYWQVRANNGFGTTYADGAATAFWAFTTGSLPGAFSKTSPANGATGVAVSPTLWWGVSAGAVSYEYCIDTTNDSACSGWVSSGSATSAGVGPLAYGTAYYWQVRANNGSGTTYADGAAYWQFTTGGPPAGFAKAAPANGAVGQPVSPTLSVGGVGGGDFV